MTVYIYYITKHHIIGTCGENERVLYALKAVHDASSSSSSCVGQVATREADTPPPYYGDPPAPPPPAPSPPTPWPPPPTPSPPSAPPSPPSAPSLPSARPCGTHGAWWPSTVNSCLWLKSRGSFINFSFYLFGNLRC